MAHPMIPPSPGAEANGDGGGRPGIPGQARRLPGTVDLGALGRKAAATMAAADRDRRGEFGQVLRRLVVAGYAEPEEAENAIKMAESGDRMVSVKTLCPIHETMGEHEPSLNVTWDRESNKVLVYCHGSCESGEVAREVLYEVDHGPLAPCKATRKKTDSLAVGGLLSDLDLRDDPSMDHLYFRWSEQQGAEDPRVARQTATYVYRDREGAEVAAKVRWETGTGAKTFIWYTKADGGWRRGTRSGGIPPYRGDEVVRSRADETVWVVEGEKDVDRLWSEGLVATSMKYVGNRRETVKALELAGRTVVVVPDDDPKGIGDAKAWVRCAEEEGAVVSVVGPMKVVGRGEGSGTDISDWFDAGGTVEELVEMGIVSGDTVDDRADDENLSNGTVLELVAEDTVEAAADVDDDLVIEGLSSIFQVRQSMLKPEWSEKTVVSVVKQAEQRYIRAEADEMYRLLTGSDEAASWVVQDLTDDLGEPVPDVLQMRDGGGCLFYSGELNMVWGKRGAGKTWIADLCIREQVRLGRLAVLLDFENGKAKIRHRLATLLGMTVRELREGVKLFNSPAGGWPGEERTGVEMTRVGVMVIDSMVGAMRALDLDSRSGDDVERFMRLNVRPFMEAGAAVLILDHVTHDESQHDRPKDSAHKLNRVQGAGFLVKESDEDPLGPGKRGWSTLTAYKDNSGGLGLSDGELAARLVVDSPGLGMAVDAWTERPPAEGMASWSARMSKQEDLIARMDEAGVPIRGKTDAIVARCHEAGISIRRQAILDAQKVRRQRADELGDAGEAGEAGEESA